MYESPQSLQDVCVDFICENIEEFCLANTDNWKENSPVFFPSSVSEQLIEELGERHKLNDKVLHLFSTNTCQLQDVKINNATGITAKGLSVLRNHKIRILEVHRLTRLNVNELIGCLGEWTLRNLQSLNVSYCTFRSSNKICVMVALSKLKNILGLNVSNTEINVRGLDIITQDLPLLEQLDISETLIRDISPLKKCKKRLKSLNMYNLQVMKFGDFPRVIQSLSNLCHLDISDDKTDPFSSNTRNSSKMTQFLKTCDCLPCLVSLDLSGNEGILSDDLKIFLDSHPSLKFLGLMLTDACFYDMFNKDTDPHYNPNLEVSGCCTITQIICSLQRYPKRKLYVQRALYYLYSYTQNIWEPRLDIIKLVLKGMKLHPMMLGLQIGATACLYNLTKGTLVVRLHPHWLKKVVNLTLVAMKHFPKQQQLQKNALLTLCCDRILQEVAFDRYKCAEFVMESLIMFDDTTMNRLSVAICSILAAKIPTSQTSALGTRPAYMKKLLTIVESKTDANSSDVMMKFTLSALWNLTDESPSTCQVFLDMEGLNLYLKVLEVFSNDSSIQTKILGLMNNIAEVKHLREHLMKNELMIALRSLLHSTKVDVSYFAAGIIAHLASDEPSLWVCDSVPRKEVLKELGDVVLEWITPDSEMVAYRSFVPFLPLLQSCKAPEVQLWAVWAIRHVCVKNPKRYVPILIQDKGLVVINALLLSEPTHPYVQEACQKILEIAKFRPS